MAGREKTSWRAAWARAIPKGLTWFGLVVVVWAILSAPRADAGEMLSNSNYQHVGGQFGGVAAAGGRALTSAAVQSQWGPQSVSVGGTATIVPSGRLESLRSHLPGFWAVVVGAFPTLDLDGDGAQFFLDPDDDGDQLDDVFETGTGSFVSATNTGTSPTRSDSDGDGFADGVEVAVGTDPTDSGSSPAPPEVPGLSLPLAALLAGLLSWTARRMTRAR